MVSQHLQSQQPQACRGTAAFRVVVLVVAVVSATMFSRSLLVDRASAVTRDGDERTSGAHVVRELAGHVSQARALLAIHQDATSPFTDIVLWHEDSDDDERIDADELELISYHRVLRMVQSFRLDAGHAQESGSLAMERSGWRDFDRTFCDQWRTSAWVEGRCLATEVSDLSIESTGPSVAGVTPYRIEMIWAANSADAIEKSAAECRAVTGTVRAWESVQ